MAVERDPFGDPGLPVVHEHVEDVVGIPGDEIRRIRVEGDKAPIARDRRRKRAIVRLHPT